MKIKYDRMACAGWFQCVQEWDAFEMNPMQGKADFRDSEEVESEVFVRTVPSDMEETVVAAAKSCPVDAIEIFDDSGDQIEP